MASIHELQLDVEELQALQKQAKRPSVKILLQDLVKKVQDQILTERSLGLGAVDKGEEDTDKAPAKTNPAPQRPLVESITNYGHDQNAKFVSIYIDLPGVHELPSDNVKTEYKSLSVCLTVTDLKGKNYKFELSPLADFILPEESKHKIKTDKVTLMLRKKEDKKTWTGIKGSPKPEPKESSQSEIGPNEDPGEAMMKLLKNMYDNGDEEMKKSIAKAWEESRKQAQ